MLVKHKNILKHENIKASIEEIGKWLIKGDIIKYILRADKKNGLEDYRKARVYLNWLIETMESDDDPEEVEVYTNNEKYQVDKDGGFHKVLP